MTGTEGMRGKETWGASGGHRAGLFDKRVKGVREGANLHDVFAVVWFETDLAIKGPNALDPGVTREGMEMGMIGGCQVLID
jgi:hypothetical protein